MHLCLSCNQPCNISAVFCESCRLSLLERSAESQREEQQVRDGDGLVDLVSLPQMGAAPSAPLQLTEGGRLLPWQDSGRPTVRTLEAKAEEGPAGTAALGQAQPTSLLIRTAPAERRRMPTRVRRALWVFCVVGVLTLSVDGVLLALSIMRHHMVMQGVNSPPATVAVNPFQATSGTSSRSTSVPSSFGLSSARLLFTTTQGQGNPQAQTVVLFSKTQRSFIWKVVSTTSFPSWLHLSAMQGRTIGGGAQVIVGVVTSQLTPGIYTASVLVSAFDTYGKALLNSPQTLTILLTMLTPCSLSVTPEKLSFATVLLSPPTPQTLSITENGDCARPIRWQVSSTASWLTVSSTAGFDSGHITVQANDDTKLIGTSTASLLIQATDAHGQPVMGTPVTIPATLMVIA